MIVLTRMVVGICCAALCCIGAIAEAQTWLNKPSGFVTILDCPFNSVQGCGIVDAYSSSVIATDATAPISPSNAVKSTIFAGNNYGGMQLDYVTSQTFPEIYVGLMWRTNPEFYGRTVNDKMFFIRGPQTNGYFGMYACPGCTQRQFGWSHNASNVDNSHTCGDSGFWCYPNVGTPAITIGQWTKIEIYMKSSTTMTSRDGILRWWINGQPAGNYTNINYAPYGLNDWTWSETWDGYVNPVPTVDWSHFIDNLTIAVPSGSGGTSDVTPPTQVTGFSASSVTTTGATLTWSPSSDNVGVTGYALERCSGAGCTNFSPLTFVVGTTYTDTGLNAGTNYSYRNKAQDAAGNVSVSYSSTVTIATLTQNLPSILTLNTDATGANLTWSGNPASIRVQTDTLNVVEPISAFPQTPQTITYIQSRAVTGSGSSASLAYLNQNTAGNLLALRYKGDNGQTVTGVTDSSGNSWVSIQNATAGGGGAPETHVALTEFSSTQGTNGWTYLEGDYSSNTPFAWTGSFYYNGYPGAGLWDNGGFPGPFIGNIRRWTVPKAGSVRITGSAYDLDPGCTGYNVPVSIAKNGVSLWSQTVVAADTVGVTFDVTTSVTVGDVLDFSMSPTSLGCNNTYFSPTLVLTPSGSGWHQTLWYAPNSKAGVNTVTVTLSGNAASYELDLFEYAGVAQTNPLDQATVQEQIGPGTATDAVTSGSKTTTVNGELILASTMHTAGPSTTVAAGTGFTMRQNASGDSGVEEQIQSTAGSIAGTFTAASASDNFITSLATFKPATGTARYSRIWTAGTTFACFYPRDSLGNENAVSPGYQCRPVTPSVTDTTPPVRSNAQPVGPLAAGTTSAVLSLSTDESANCKYGTVAGTVYGSIANSFTAATGGLFHSATVTGLSNGTTYTYYVRCQDVSGNANTTDFTVSFQVASAAGDVTAPSQVTGFTGTILSQTQANLSWTAATDDIGVVGYELFQCDVSLECPTSSLVSTVTGTSTILAGLIAGHSYQFTVRAFDLAGNRGAFSTAVTLTALAADTTPPSNLTGMTVTPVDFQSLDVNWSPGTDNAGVAATIIEQCQGAACTTYQVISKVSSGTTLRVAGLQPTTAYRFRGKHVDAAGNISVDYSTDATGETLDIPPGTIMGLCPCKGRR